MGETEGSNGQGRSPSLSPDLTLNLVLIGEREAGKSAAGNAILGTMAFDRVGVQTRTSVRRQGLVRGTRVVLVDTPGWEWFNLGGRSASPGTVRKEMMASMALCRSGAHVLLLVVPLSFSFSARERRVVEENVELFGSGAWSHTLVLFTVKDSKLLRTHSLQEEVESNKEMQKLVEKCDRRYHALHGGGPGRVQSQVTELMAKIWDLVSANGESVILSDIVLELARKREKEEEEEEEKERRKEEERREREKMERAVRGESALRGEEERRERRLKSETLDGSARPNSSDNSTGMATFWNVCNGTNFCKTQ